MKPIVEDNISITIIHDTVQLRSPLWPLKQFVVIFLLKQAPEKYPPNYLTKKKPFNIREKYPNYSHIYTDGSKDSNKTGCGAVFSKKKMKKCLPNESSVQ